MTLDSYLGSGGGHDGVLGAKILVVVKSVGARKRVTRKNGGGELELVEVRLFDNTGEVRWTLWGDGVESAREWQAGRTVLLISSPGFRVEAYGGGKGSLGLQHGTMVDVDPDFPDVEWLRKYAVGLTKRESLCVEFPHDVFGEDIIEGAENGVNRIMFRLAEIDEWYIHVLFLLSFFAKYSTNTDRFLHRVRMDPRNSFTGHINVTIMDMSFVKLHRQHMLMCNEWFVRSFPPFLPSILSLLPSNSSNPSTPY